MSSAASTSASSPPAEDVRPRRKLRKGAKSCQECKRRKVRCFFRSAEDASCVACRRRGTHCEGQEFLLEEDNRLDVGDRLIRLENLMRNLLDRVGPSDLGAVSRSHDPSISRENSLRPPTSFRGSSGATLPSRRDESSTSPIPETHTRISPALQDPPPSSGVTREALYNAFPPQQTVNVLAEATRAWIILPVPGNHYHTFLSPNSPALDYATLPAPTSHPVILARKLLHVAAMCQQLNPFFDHSQLDLPGPPKQIWARYLELASQVTRNESFWNSGEMLDSLILESILLVSSGNLRRAFICIRRGLTVAYFLGVHKSGLSSVELLDPTTYVTPSGLWFRLVFVERYLSLLLGFPSAIPGSAIPISELPPGSSDVEKVDRALAVAIGRINERNETGGPNEFETTLAIDQDLQESIKRLPSDWWVAPVFTIDMHSAEMLGDIVRAQAQIIHYNILTILHLPFMLRYASEPGYEYSKKTCINASREVLTRFCSFRRFLMNIFCCRWVDFSAFTAAMALLLAHLDSHRNSNSEMTSYRRLSDRTLIESAMELVDELNRIHHDTLSRQTAEITRTLLALEADTANGNCVSTTSNVNDQDSASPNVRKGQLFTFNIPYLGTVKVNRETPTLTPPSLLSLSTEGSFSGNTSSSPWTAGSPGAPPSILATDPPTSLEQIDSRQWSLSLEPFIAQERPSLVQECLTGGIEDSIDFQDLAMQDLITQANNRTFPGVDMAFFNSVFGQDMNIPPDWDSGYIPQ